MSDEAMALRPSIAPLGPSEFAEPLPTKHLGEDPCKSSEPPQLTQRPPGPASVLGDAISTEHTCPASAPAAEQVAETTPCAAAPPTSNAEANPGNAVAAPVAALVAGSAALTTNSAPVEKRQQRKTLTPDEKRRKQEEKAKEREQRARDKELKAAEVQQRKRQAEEERKQRILEKERQEAEKKQIVYRPRPSTHGLPALPILCSLSKALRRAVLEQAAQETSQRKAVADAERAALVELRRAAEELAREKKRYDDERRKVEREERRREKEEAERLRRDEEKREKEKKKMGGQKSLFAFSITKTTATASPAKTPAAASDLQSIPSATLFTDLTPAQHAQQHVPVCSQSKTMSDAELDAQMSDPLLAYSLESLVASTSSELPRPSMSVDTETGHALEVVHVSVKTKEMRSYMLHGDDAANKNNGQKQKQPCHRPPYFGLSHAPGKRLIESYLHACTNPCAGTFQCNARIARTQYDGGARDPTIDYDVNSELEWWDGEPSEGESVNGDDDDKDSIMSASDSTANAMVSSDGSISGQEDIGVPGGSPVPGRSRDDRKKKCRKRRRLAATGPLARLKKKPEGSSSEAAKKRKKEKKEAVVKSSGRPFPASDDESHNEAMLHLLQAIDQKGDSSANVVIEFLTRHNTIFKGSVENKLKAVSEKQWVPGTNGGLSGTKKIRKRWMIKPEVLTKYSAVLQQRNWAPCTPEIAQQPNSFGSVTPQSGIPKGKAKRQHAQKSGLAVSGAKGVKPSPASPAGSLPPLSPVTPGLNTSPSGDPAKNCTKRPRGRPSKGIIGMCQSVPPHPKRRMGYCVADKAAPVDPACVNEPTPVKTSLGSASGVPALSLRDPYPPCMSQCPTTDADECMLQPPLPHGDHVPASSGLSPCTNPPAAVVLDPAPEPCPQERT
eukprot:gene3929-720_t